MRIGVGDDTLLTASARYNTLLQSVRLPLLFRLLLLRAQADRAVVTVSLARLALLAGPDSVLGEALREKREVVSGGIRGVKRGAPGTLRLSRRQNLHLRMLARRLGSRYIVETPGRSYDSYRMDDGQ
jgi:hypothetical protein